MCVVCGLGNTACLRRVLVLCRDVSSCQHVNPSVASRMSYFTLYHLAIKKLNIEYFIERFDAFWLNGWNQEVEQQVTTGFVNTEKLHIFQLWFCKYPSFISSVVVCAYLVLQAVTFSMMQNRKMKDFKILCNWLVLSKDIWVVSILINTFIMCVCVCFNISKYSNIHSLDSVLKIIPESRTSIFNSNL